MDPTLRSTLKAALQEGVVSRLEIRTATDDVIADLQAGKFPTPVNGHWWAEPGSEKYFEVEEQWFLFYEKITQPDLDVEAALQEAAYFRSLETAHIERVYAEACGAAQAALVALDEDVDERGLSLAAQALERVGSLSVTNEAWLAVELAMASSKPHGAGKGAEQEQTET